MLLELPGAPANELPSLWCIFERQQLLLINGQLPQASEIHLCNLTHQQFIGQLNGHNLFMANWVEGFIPDNALWLPLRAAMMEISGELIPAIARATELQQFQHTHRYCGHCATPLRQHQHDQGKNCPSCGQLYYPRLSPAMMVAIYRGKELLLARSPHFKPGVYSALAGFVEPGETLEDCVHRESFEEVAVRLHSPTYACSQSWPFPHSLMLAFTAEYADGTITPQEGEIEDARWFHIDRLPELPPSISIANKLIKFTIEKLQRT